MSETGKPAHFDVEIAQKFLQMNVDSDNVVNALKMAEMLPAYYREKQHDWVELWKKNVWAKVATINDYSSGELKEISKENSLTEYKAIRFQIVEQLVRHWNDQRRPPFIVDLGPGEYTLPIGLKEAGLEFNYKPIAITNKIPEVALPYIEDVLADKGEFHQPVIFVCFEMIEHLFNPDDVVNYYHRENLNAEHVVISTPHGALGGGWKRTNAEMIAHVRDWTPKELTEFCYKHWGYMNWQLQDGVQMCAVGSRVNG